MIRRAAQSSRHAYADCGFDFYPTPPEAVAGLLTVEKLPRPSCDPATGSGGIVRPLRGAGLKIAASDIAARGFQLDFVADFLTITAAPAGDEAIISNPPCRLAERFVAHVLDLVPRVLMLLRLAFLEAERRARILDDGKLARVHVPSANLKGWCDVNARAAMMRRFAEHEAAGRQCILLLCGDHDPGGLNITNTMRSNLEELKGAVGWSPANLVITRFRLNADFINLHRLTWIDNLETSSGQRLDDPRHADHYKPYVQDYIRRFGVRKCEANALVVAPEVGRQLCRDAILQYVPADAPEDYRDRVTVERHRLMVAIQQLMGGAS